MAKILIGPDGGSYSFNKTAKQVSLSLPSGRQPRLEELLLITDSTNNTIIYNFADPTKGATLSNNVFTLTFNTNTASFNNTDKLQIYYYDTTPQSITVDDMAAMLRIILQHGNKNNENSLGRQKVMVEDGNISYINSIGSGFLTTVTNIANPGFRGNEDLTQQNITNNWYNKVRKQIS
jgi:hypothetical protein